MYGDRCSAAYSEGVRSFCVAAEANKRRDGFMICPCVECRNEKDYTNGRLIQSHLLRSGSCPAIIFGQSTEKEGL